ncbi:hypothetical protein ACLB2K_073759 [Fragaria x ananassa]
MIDSQEEARAEVASEQAIFPTPPSPKEAPTDAETIEDSSLIDEDTIVVSAIQTEAREKRVIENKNLETEGERGAEEVAIGIVQTLEEIHTLEAQVAELQARLANAKHKRDLEDKLMKPDLDACEYLIQALDKADIALDQAKNRLQNHQLGIGG